MSDEDYAGETLGADRPSENHLFITLDAHRAIKYLELVADGIGPGFSDTLRDTRDLWPIDPADIAMPDPLWLLDEDGRGLSVMEQRHIVGLAALLRLNAFAETLTIQTRIAA